MNSNVIGGLVKDVDDKGVTLSCPYCWTWILPINCCYHLIMAESRNSQVVHLYLNNNGNQKLEVRSTLCNMLNCPAREKFCWF
jgi:hypothetical protein